MSWIIVLTLILPLASSCPKNLHKEIKHCLKPVKGYANEIDAIGMLQTELETTSELCRDGSIQSAFECLNKLYNRCAKSKEASRDFDLIIDANKWRDAMNNICNHIHYLKDHVECEGRVKNEFMTCVTRQLVDFNQQKDSLHDAEMSDADRTDALIDIICLNTDKVLNCLKTPYEKYCPKPMTTLLINTVKSFTPKVCTNRISTLGQPFYETPKSKTRHHEDDDNDDDEDGEEEVHIIKTKVVVEFPSQSDNGAFDKNNKDEPYVKEESEPKNPPSVSNEFENRGVVGAAKKQQSENGAGVKSFDVWLTSFCFSTAATYVTWTWFQRII
ncbi:hypothetical protein Btru_037537 [Bulinus truncatus]|nr:hypothetical protein Btru_037537 [Bulinus truncatus]